MTIEQQTRAASMVELARLSGLLNHVAAQPGGACTHAGFHGLRATSGAAMLVEPLNAPPFVFCLAAHKLREALTTDGHPPQGTITTFVGEPGSGTQALRARIQATLFYEQVVREHQAQRPACLDELTEDQRDLVQDALANWDSTSDEEMAQHWCASGLTAEQAAAALRYRDQFALNPSFTLWPVREDAGTHGHGSRAPTPRP